MGLFVRHRGFGLHHPSRVRARQRPSLEMLEGRRLLAYTFTLFGTSATATGDSASDRLVIGASGGLLYHLVNGSISFSWNTGSSSSTLPAGAGSMVLINLGTGTETVKLISSSTPGESLNGTAFNLVGGAPWGNTLQVDDSANTTAGNTYTVTADSIVGPGFEAYFANTDLGGGINLGDGTGGNTINVLSTKAGQLVSVIGGGPDSVTLGGGIASTALGGNVVVWGPSGEVALTVDDSADPTGQNMTLSGNIIGTNILNGLGKSTIAASVSQLNTYAVLAGKSTDTLSVDLSAGNPIPTGGLTFNGGGGQNTLDVNAGGRAAKVTTPGVVTLAGTGPLNYAAVAAVNIVNAADGPLTPIPLTINTIERAPLTGVTVGAFTDADSNTAASSYAAQIDWGDGTTSAGTVVADPKSGFDVVGSHTYVDPGTFGIHASIVDHGNTGVTSLAGVPVSVSDPGGASTTIDSTAVVAPRRQTFVVTTTADLVNGVPAEGSLRANILAANAHPGADTIVFDIASRTPVEDIKLNAPLPAVTSPVTIDATTQPGYQGQPIVVVDGSATSGDGLKFDVGNSAVRGLVIAGFSGAGINLGAGGGDLIQNDFIGTTASGQSAAGNGVGISITGGTGTTIGGTATGAGNTISGNFRAGVYVSGGTGTLILGNRIGSNPAGTAPVVRGGTSNPLRALQNTGVLIVNSGGNSVRGNVVSGNCVGAMVAGPGANAIQGNLIGTNVFGSGVLSNIVGVSLNGASGNVVGGTAPGTGNTISGNSSVGVAIVGRSAGGNLVQGNLIGLAADGRSALRAPNGRFVQRTGVLIQAASGNTIGGSIRGAGNTITGNRKAGVFILSWRRRAAGNVVEGDSIGLDSTGARGPGNAGYGVLVYDAPRNRVVRTGPFPTRFGRNVFGNVAVFTGPLPASSGECRRTGKEESRG